MKRYLKFKAGPNVIDMIRDEGLKPERVYAFAAPAGGPKWFISVGFDRAVINSRFLERAGHRVLLAGASAGAWRCIAMACRDPLDAYERLRIAYSRNVFSALDTPATLGEALKKNVESFVNNEDIPYILEHPVFDLAVHSVRGRGIGASENAKIQGTALILGGIFNAVSRTGMNVFFESVVFFSGERAPLFTRGSFTGVSVRLNSKNLRSVAVATGSLPYIVAGVQNIPGAPRGVYRDGGLLDYQLNRDYCPVENGGTLFFHYQERIVPGWFDKHLPRRKPQKGVVARVIQVYPSEDFVRLLPGRRLPDRSDFKMFVENPAERIRRWDEVSKLSEILGEEFLQAVESRSISRQIEVL